MNSIKMKLDSKHRITKSNGKRNPSFRKELVENADLYNPFEQINDHTQMLHKMQFRSSFVKILSGILKCLVLNMLK